MLIHSRSERKRNRARRDIWRHLLLKESERAENELELVNTVSYNISLGYIIRSYLGFSIKYSLYVIGCKMIYSIYNIIFINGRIIN